jgi:hypothetical protein
MNDELFGLKGTAEILLEDRQGRVKRRVTAKNTLSEAFKRYILYDAFNHSSLGGLLGAAVGASYTALARSAPSLYYLCALKAPIQVTPHTYTPPYFQKAMVGLNENVAFYGAASLTAETDKVMTRANAKCYNGFATRETVAEYRKNTGAGWVAAIAVGSQNSTFAQACEAYRVPQIDWQAPLDWTSQTSGQWLTEHTEEGTVLYKYVDAGGTVLETRVESFNLQTKAYVNYGPDPAMRNSILALTAGTVVGDDIFRVALQSATAPNYIVRLQFIRDWRHQSAVQTRDITVPNTNTVTPTMTPCHPVLVYNRDTGSLEIFQTTSQGRHVGDAYGYTVAKITVNPTSLETATEYSGVQPYGVSTYPAAPTNNYYAQGFCGDGEYRLPVSHVWVEPTYVPLAWYDANVQHGIVTNGDLTEVKDFCGFRWTGFAAMAYAHTDLGVMPVIPSMTGLPCVFQSQMVSALNLETPILKEEEDVLRILYHYGLA